MPLSASASVVLIDASSNTGNVNISWNFPFDIMLTERLYKVGASPSFQRRPIPDTMLQSGSYSQVLTPGDIYEVRAFDRTLDASNALGAAAERHAIGQVKVVALQRQSSLETNRNEAVGGTFYRYTTHTGTTMTVAWMDIGRDDPPPDAAGFRTMPDPIMKVDSSTAGVTHNLTTDKIIFDLPPSEREKLTSARVALVTIMDGTGGWQQIVRNFRTLQRKLTIEFDQIDVQSIGEPPSETEGEMRFLLEVWERRFDTWEQVRSFAFENHHVTLTPFKVRDFVLDPVVVVGPRPVHESVVGVSVHVREFDPWPFVDETATSMTLNSPTPIEVKLGEGAENDVPPLTLTAKQQYDPFDPEESLWVDVSVRVKVEHV